MEAKLIYNLDSTEKFSEAKIIGGNPNGIINFNDTPHQWAVSLYRQMEGNQWYVEECDLGQDKVPYRNLPEDSKYAYDMCLSQLITNDSIQTNQLVDSINQYVTSPVVNACLVLQAYQESLHSRSYAVAADEVCDDSDRIYNLHKYEPALARKNKAVGDMYATINSGSKSTEQELLIAFAANQILEELVFPGGFVTLWSMGTTMGGKAKDISFIERDESGTHVPLFKNIFNSSVALIGLEPTTKQRIMDMIEHMTNEEKIWTKHITKKLLGFSDKAVDLFIEEKANSVCRNLKLPLLYTQTDGGPLMSIVDRYSMLGTKTKANFFEVPVGDYAINTLDEDY